MERKKRILTFVTFLICTICLSLLTASLTTHKWISVKPVRLTFINGSIIELNVHHQKLREARNHNLESSSLDYDHDHEDQDGDQSSSKFESLKFNSKSNSTSPRDKDQSSRDKDLSSSSAILDLESENRKFRGNIYFGLFQGTKILNYGFGDRVTHLSMKDELLRNPNLMPFGLWLFTILCVAIAIIFGLVASIFAIINTVMSPIEVITGLHGLFLWNGMGALFCTGACVSWIVQFRTKLRRNVLTPEELEDGWSSENRARLGYSFFLVVIALALYLFNIFLISLATSTRRSSSKSWNSRKLTSGHRPVTISDKNPEGVIMLY